MIKRTGMVLLAVITIVFLSGCTENMSAEQITQKMKEKHDSIKDFSATMVLTSTLGGHAGIVKVKTINKMPGMSRMEYLEPAEIAGQVVVSDGRTFWTYDPNKKEVTKMDMPEISLTFEQDYTKSIKELLSQTDISYKGTENFEGRNVYLITATPRDGDIWQGMRFNLWVDSETWIPLKMDTIDKNDNLLTSVEYRDVKYNTGIPDTEFEFKVPEGAKVVTREPLAQPKKMTLEEVRKEVNFTVMSPSYLPEGYIFDSATVFKYDGTESVSLLYLNSSSTLVLTEEMFDDTQQPDFGEVEKVSINGSEGKLISLPGSNMLIWNNGKLELMLSGAFSKEDIIKVAGSIK